MLEVTSFWGVYVLEWHVLGVTCVGDNRCWR